MTTALTVVVLVCFAYLLLVNLVALAFLAIGAFENAVRKHDADSNDFATLETSRFTIPVSVIVAAYDEEVVIESTVASLLAFDYPEFEVVVVNDGSSDETLERLDEAFDLAPYEMFVRRIFTTQHVRGIYRSRDTRTSSSSTRRTAARPTPGTRRSTSRGTATSAVSTRTRVFDPKALLMAMRVAINDPARIIGVTSQITTAPRSGGCARPPGGGSDRRRVARLYQHLDFIRAFLNNRLAWSRLGFMLCSPGGFRSGGGTSSRRSAATRPTFTCEDIELTFRIHERYRREGRDYEIRCLPDSVGVTEGPGRRREARVAARALAAGDQRDRRALPPHVVQPALRLGRDDRRAVLPA